MVKSVGELPSEARASKGKADVRAVSPNREMLSDSRDRVEQNKATG